METVHHFFNASLIVPPMDIKDIDVVGAQPFQGGPEREIHALGVVTHEVRRVACLGVEVLEFIRVLVQDGLLTPSRPTGDRDVPSWQLSSDLGLRAFPSTLL